MRILRILLLILAVSPLALFANTDKALAADSLPRIFPRHALLATYQTHIDFKERSFSGLLLIRENADQSFRIAFVTEVGLKIFEFQFFTQKKESFHLVSILSYLDRKIVINTLRRDFESLFMTFAAYRKAKISDGKIRYCYQGKRIYFTENHRITHMIRRKFFIKKEDIELAYGQKDLAERIDIRHKGVNLHIKMKLIKG